MFKRPATAVLLTAMTLGPVAWMNSPALAQPAAAVEASAEEVLPEQLVIFMPAEGSAVRDGFVERDLPKIEDAMSKMKVPVKVIEVGERGGVVKLGLPEDVTLLPVMVFQNHAGRFPYLGRTTTVSRLVNHVRTSRFNPGDTVGVYGSEPIAQLGRVQLGIPLKITDIEGDKLSIDEQAEFTEQAKAWITQGMDRFSLPEGSSPTGPSDRLFYGDVYPFRGEDGKLFLSWAVFSQFHCHVPVYVSETPIEGTWAEREAALTKAGAQIQAEVMKQVASMDNGDGFVAIPAAMDRASWEDLGFVLPPKPEKAEIDTSNLEIVPDWVIDESAAVLRPMVQFTFPAPIRGYAGEATAVEGEFKLGEGLSLKTATGTFIVPATAVTMGEPDLDAHLKDGILEASEHPEANFALESVATGADQPAFGQIIPITMSGTFTMKGVSVPLSVPAQVDVFVGDDGKPRLAIEGTWSLSLKEPFAIEDAPPGPADKASTLVFTCYLVFKPAS